MCSVIFSLNCLAHVTHIQGICCCCGRSVVRNRLHVILILLLRNYNILGQPVVMIVVAMMVMPMTVV